jgi:hypothetical protein
MKDWEIIADNLSKAGWGWGWVSAIDSNGQMFHRAMPATHRRLESYTQRRTVLANKEWLVRFSRLQLSYEY